MNSSQPTPPDPDDTIDVIALVRLLWGSRILIACVAAVFGIAAAVLALLATPMYRAEAVVTLASDGGPAGAGASLGGRIGGLASLVGLELGAARVGSQEAQAILKSRRLVEEYVRRNGLTDVLLPPGSEHATEWFAAQKFRDLVLTIAEDEQDGTTTLAIEWTDPAVAARWANGLVALANELMRSKALADSKRNIEYLKKQIEATDVVEMQRVMYELIENETKTLMLASARGDFAFTVVDPATVAEARSRPKRRLMVMTGLALGLVLGALFVFGRDTVRRYRAREARGVPGST